jgi:glycyl-tRNA synthetase (class II)
MPYVIEPAAGVTRTAMTFLIDAYEEEEIGTDKKGNPDIRTVLHFHPRIAPITVAVFPLVKKNGMPELHERPTRSRPSCASRASRRSMTRRARSAVAIVVRTRSARRGA